MRENLILILTVFATLWAMTGLIAFWKDSYPEAKSRREWWKIIFTRWDETIGSLIIWPLMGPIAFTGRSSDSDNIGNRPS